MSKEKRKGIIYRLVVLPIVLLFVGAIIYYFIGDYVDNSEQFVYFYLIFVGFIFFFEVMTTFVSNNKPTQIEKEFKSSIKVDISKTNEFSIFRVPKLTSGVILDNYIITDKNENLIYKIASDGRNYNIYDNSEKHIGKIKNHVLNISSSYTLDMENITKFTITGNMMSLMTSMDEYKYEYKVDNLPFHCNSNLVTSRILKNDTEECVTEIEGISVDKSEKVKNGEKRLVFNGIHYNLGNATIRINEDVDNKEELLFLATLLVISNVKMSGRYR